MPIDSKTLSAKKAAPGKLYDTFFVSEYGKLEALRAGRYNTQFSILLLTIDGIDAQIHDDEASDFIKKTSNKILEAIRPCDVAGMADDRQVAIILPETDYFGSLIAIRKLTKSLSTALTYENPPKKVIMSQATFPNDGRGYGALISTASKRMADKKESLWEKNEFRTKLFWEIIGDITGSTYKGFENSSFDLGGGQSLSESFIDQINELIIREITLAPHKRGIAFFAAKKLSTLPAINTLGHIGTLSTKVFLIGQSEDSLREIKNATPIFLDDPRLRETFFTLYLTEDSGYSLICRENWGATFSCFHSSDAYLVDGLINKFQLEYSLQEQL
ncbi:MAG: hypothetical protein A3J24_08570 [Deltaproteobacteria bacterium RIFCSPLOWO2_02_FULL_53_8]|nr:MAG: hypothetical protein A3J24_08570 [Deltaproteobacteria bacterium RIFCSPLOWO2_02_FULL_53_8]